MHLRRLCCADRFGEVETSEMGGTVLRSFDLVAVKSLVESTPCSKVNVKMKGVQFELRIFLDGL